MKRNILLGLVLSAAIIACKPKGKMATAAPAGPTDKQLAAAKTKFPDVTIDQLRKGHNLFNTSCTRCHAAKDVTPYTDQELNQTLDVMAQKAELTADEKNAVLRYAVAVRLAK